jgi:hypothetical protein
MEADFENASGQDAASSPSSAFAALALSAADVGGEWAAIDTYRLPRQAFELVVAFARTELVAEALDALVSIRNALTRDGRLLVVLGPRAAWGDLRDLASRAGFTRVRELSVEAQGSPTLEFRR